MTQELLDLRTSILEGRYQDALAIVDDLEGMSKQAIIRNIESFLEKLMIHLIKNQIEQRLTNSWANSVSDSIVQIKKLNRKDNKTSYYINSDEWLTYLEAAVKLAIRPASLEIFNGQLKPKQVSQRSDITALIATAKTMLDLTYSGSRCYEVHSEITKLISYSRYHYIWCTSLQREPLYTYAAEDLPDRVDIILAELPGGEEWQSD